MVIRSTQEGERWCLAVPIKRCHIVPLPEGKGLGGEVLLALPSRGGRHNVAIQEKVRRQETDNSVILAVEEATKRPAWAAGLPSPGPRYASRGMVASASPAAAAAGLRVLMEGGTA